MKIFRSVHHRPQRRIVYVYCLGQTPQGFQLFDFRLLRVVEVRASIHDTSSDPVAIVGVELDRLERISLVEFSYGNRVWCQVAGVISANGRNDAN